MRVRIHMAGGDVIDAEQFSPDGGASWSAILPAQILGVMTAAGYSVVRDVFTGDWRALKNERIESIGPAPDLNAAVDAEVERRITRVLAEQLPARVEAVLPASDPPSSSTPAPPETGDME